MFGPYPGIVETSGNRMRLSNLPVIALQKIGAVSMENARSSGRKRSRLLAGFDTVTGCFDPDDLDTVVVKKWME